MKEINRQDNTYNGTITHGQSDDFFRNVNIQFLIHEMKGPLSVLDTNIKMLLEMQKEFGKLSPIQQKMLDRSKRSAAKLRNIIHSILEVGSSQSGRVDPVRFKVVPCTLDVMTNALEIVAGSATDIATEEDPRRLLARNNVEFTISSEVQELELTQDQNKFMYILGNLTRNAFHHRSSKITINMKVSGTNLLVLISDDGPGIPAEEQKKIFSFYKSKSNAQRRYKGHGLGLATSRIIVRHLGGDITINDNFREGTQFILQIPILFNREESAGKHEIHHQK